MTTGFTGVLPVANGGTNASASIAYSLFGNTANNTTGGGYFAIGGLTNKSSPATTDILILQDQAAGWRAEILHVGAMYRCGFVRRHGAQFFDGSDHDYRQ